MCTLEQARQPQAKGKQDLLEVSTNVQIQGYTWFDEELAETHNICIDVSAEHVYACVYIEIVLIIHTVVIIQMQNK